MNEYNNDAGLPPTIPPPEWIHNVTCYSPLLLKNESAWENSEFPLWNLIKGTIHKPRGLFG